MQTPATVDNISTAASKDSKGSFRATVRSFEAHDRPPRRKSWQANQVHSDSLQGASVLGGGWVEAEGEESVLVTAASIDPERRNILQVRPELLSLKSVDCKGPSALRGVSATTSGAGWEDQLQPSFCKPQEPETRPERPSSLDGGEGPKNLPPTWRKSSTQRGGRGWRSRLRCQQSPLLERGAPSPRGSC